MPEFHDFGEEVKNMENEVNLNVSAVSGCAGCRNVFYCETGDYEMVDFCPFDGNELETGGDFDDFFSGARGL